MWDIHTSVISDPWFRPSSNLWLRTHVPELNTGLRVAITVLCTVCWNFKSVGGCLILLFYKSHVSTREDIVTQVEKEGTQEIKIP